MLHGTTMMPATSTQPPALAPVVFRVGLLSASGLLALDTVLPALPHAQMSLGVDEPSAYGIVSAFLLGVALSQLVWGNVASRLGLARALIMGIGALVTATLIGAMSSNIELLVAARFIAGMGAGVIPVAAPTLIRSLLAPTDQVRGMAALASVESLAPAVGPILGLLAMPWTGWRGLLVALAAVAGLAWLASRSLVPTDSPRDGRPQPCSYLDLLSDARVVRLGAAHALALGTLLGIVTSAPQLMAQFGDTTGRSFAWMQVIGVGSFIAGATAVARSRHLSNSWSTVRIPSLLQGAVLLGIAGGVILMVDHAREMLIAGWGLFCLLMGLRGPTGMTAALQVTPDAVPRTAALMMATTLTLGALIGQASASLIKSAYVQGPMLLGAIFLGVSTLLCWRR